MLKIGSVLDGKYKILSEIGRGGMSIVYLAMNEKANKPWAVKEVRKDGVKDFEVVHQGLIAETEILKRLNHPNLPSIVDVIDQDDTFLIVMDYIEGKSLDYKLKKEGAQPQERVVEWAKQICDVLGYLHSCNPPIIYRDLKPANIMLQPNGQIMIIDFGTAREYKESSVDDTRHLGTRGYAAPEQFEEESGMHTHGQTDGRTDIYTLGATLYHLLTGHNPCVYPYKMYPIREWDPTLSTGLEKIIRKCTQENPDDRYQNCAELLYALEHYTELDGAYRKQQLRKMRRFLATSIIAIAAFAGFIGFRVMDYKTAIADYDNLIAAGDNFKLGNTEAAVGDTSTIEVYNENAAGTSVNQVKMAEITNGAELTEEDYYNCSAACYIKAIENDPETSTAYTKLQELFEGGISGTEHELTNAEMTTLIGYVVLSEGSTGDASSQETTDEDSTQWTVTSCEFAEDEEALADYCFNLGVYYYLYYTVSDTSSGSDPTAQGKENAAKWFELVEDEGWFADAQEGSEDAHKHEMAVLLSDIGEKYSMLATSPGYGSSTYSYSEYWEDLTALEQEAVNYMTVDSAESDSSNIENFVFAVYQEVVEQILQNNGNFRDKDIGEEAQLNMLRDIETQLSSLTEDYIGSDRIESLREKITKAQTSVQDAYDSYD